MDTPRRLHGVLANDIDRAAGAEQPTESVAKFTEKCAGRLLADPVNEKHAHARFARFSVAHDGSRLRQRRPQCISNPHGDRVSLS
jgi:hypothetical protein